MGDMIGFILPISQLNNTDSLYLFDLVESVDLGVLEYSGMKVHCCFIDIVSVFPALEC